jgi:hypothetical protein
MPNVRENIKNSIKKQKEIEEALKKKQEEEKKKTG